MWWIYAILAAFFAALTAIFSKVGVKGISSDLATAIRTVVILILVWGIVLYKKEWVGSRELSKYHFLFLVFSGIATELSWLFYFRALSMAKVSQVAPVDKLSVAIAVVLSMVFLGESPDFKTLAGALLIVVGTVVMIL